MLHIIAVAPKVGLASFYHCERHRADDHAHQNDRISGSGSSLERLSQQFQAIPRVVVPEDYASTLSCLLSADAAPIAG